MASVMALEQSDLDISLITNAHSSCPTFSQSGLTLLGWLSHSTSKVSAHISRFIHADFKICSVNNDIAGLNKSVNNGSTSAYLWEWFTTKPWADSGEVRFVRFHPSQIL